jgi:hypothetical protein
MESRSNWSRTAVWSLCVAERGSQVPNSPLRVGLLIDSFVQPRWIVKIIADLQASEIAEIVLIVKNGVEMPSTSKLQSAWCRRNTILYEIYNRADRRWFTPRFSAFENQDISQMVEGLALIEAVPIRKGVANYFSETDIERIAPYRLDVLLRFGFGILRGTILNLPRFGIWSHHHGDVDSKRGGPPGFWELMEDEPVTGSVLQKIGEELDNGAVLYRSFSKTDPWSVTRCTNDYYWKTAEFVTRTMARVYHDPGYISSMECSRGYQPYSNRLYRAPRNTEMGRCAVRLGGRYLSAKMRSAFFLDQWMMAYRVDERADRPADTFHRFRELVPPKDRFWADPFPTTIDGTRYIFFEELPYKTRKGHICVIALDGKGVASGEPVKVLETDTHLSYPLIFEWEQNLYMMPETGSKRTIEVYRCERFPDIWRLDRTIMKNVRAVDSTLHWSQGLWWLFVNIACEGASKNDECHLFYGESPLGPWRPHPLNPIRTDVRSARPAGRLFEYKGALYRPAQDLSRTPHFAVTINRVNRMTTTEYHETEHSRFDANWRPGHMGCHTLNYHDGLTVIDVMQRRFRF